MANLVNVIGVNNLGGSPRVVNPAQLNAPQMPQVDVSSYPEYAQQQDITDAKYAQIRQDKERQYQAYIDQINASGMMKQAELQQRGVNPRTSGMGAVLSTVGTALLDFYGKDQERKAAKLQEQQQLAALDARKALEEVFNDASGRIEQFATENGAFTTEEDMKKILERYTDLPPDLQEPLIEWAGTQLREVTRSVNSRQREFAEENRNATINSAATLLQTQLHHQIAALADGRMSQTQIDNGINGIFQWLTEQTADYDPTMRMRIMQPVLESVLENSTEGSRQYMAISQRVSDMNAAFQAVEQGRSTYGDDPVQWQYFLWGLGTQFPSVSDLIGKVPNNLDLYGTMTTYDGYRRQQAEWQVNDYRQQQQQANMRPGNYQDMATGLELAWNMAQPGSEATRIYSDLNRRKPEDRTPAEQFALDQYEKWQAAQNQLTNLRNQLSTEQQQYAQWVAGNGQPKMYVDQVTGQQRPLLDQNGNPVVESYTQQEIEARYQRVQDIEAEIQSLIQQTSVSGFNLANPQDNSFLQELTTQMEAAQRAEATRPALIEGAGLAPPGSLTSPQEPPGANVAPNSPRGVLQRAGIPGFNWGLDDPPPGYQIAVPPVNRLSQISDPQYGVVRIPIADNGVQRNITITSEYGMRNLFGEERMHWGIDISTGDEYDRDTGAVAMSGGYVVGAEDANGYGGTVTILTGEGYTEQYNHLRRFFVKPGDFVASGTPLGLIGGDPSDPMAGRTTGRHLHFQVWKPGYDWTGTPSEESTIDPLTYLAHLQTAESVPQGIGLPPTTVSNTYVPTPNTLPTGNGNFLSPVSESEFPMLHAFLESTQLPSAWVYGSPHQTTRGNVNPAPSALAPINVDAYPSRNDPTANYGYQILEEDRDFAAALAEVCDEIGIPAQWLADVMEAESGFSNSVVNAIGATGLIQFMPETAAGLGYTTAEIAQMSRAQQTRTVVRAYLNQFKGLYHSIEDLYESIYAGRITDPASRQSLSDGWSTFPEMIGRFGNSVGRRYRSSYDLQSSIMHVHEEPDPSCAVCQQQLNRFGAIIPHEAQVA